MSKQHRREAAGQERLMEYEAVIGLEVHVQLKTGSKMFCACPNRFGAVPNTLVCPVCMGYPGVLPTPNRTAIVRTVAAGLLTGCEIAKFSKFDRKSYFYPDMPKNYQISQYDLPFCSHGSIRIGGRGFCGEPLTDKAVGITRIHLEEDVAKLTHFARCSGVDYNRAGVPLMEIVSEPEMHSPDEAYAYLTELKQILEYAGISDCDMEKAQLRCDVNVSLRPAGEQKLGVKIEIKNLNSFRSVHRALTHEIQRQSRELAAGSRLRQETRGWNDDQGETYPMRGKEFAHDYRYFPDPDLMPVVLSPEDVEGVRATLPELPSAKRQRFVRDFGLTEYDAEVLTQDRSIAEFFDHAAASGGSPKLLANWIISELLRELSAAAASIHECRITPRQLSDLIKLIENGTISGKIAKEVFGEMFASGKDAATVVKSRGLEQVSDADAVMAFVEQAIAASQPQVEQYRAGNAKVLQFLVGQVMKLSRGKANPQLVVGLLRDKLG